MTGMHGGAWVAAFNDQFDRLETLKAIRAVPSELWLRRNLYQAIEVLSGKDIAVLKVIGSSIEKVLAEKDAVSRSREFLGDISLLELHDDLRKVVRGLKAQGVEADNADVYATMALWKFVDYLDARSASTTPPAFQWLPHQALNSADFSAAQAGKPRAQEIAIGEAIYGSATAWTLRQLDEAGLRNELNESIKAYKNEMSKKGAQAKHALLAQHKALALKMANEGGFTSRAAAALHIASNIEKGMKDGKPTFYTPDTIDKWLKEAGWKAAKKK